VLVNEVLAKIIAGSPVAIFGLRKIGKSSLMGRVEDILLSDSGSVTATAFLLGNATRISSGRWWHVAQDAIRDWQSALDTLAKKEGLSIRVKAEKLSDAISR
jgi:AAA+ ATPase superfamily predicted ATPase